MAGNKPIKFGLNDVYRKHTGYKPKKIADGFPKQEHTRFANQIKMNDIWNALGGKDKVPAKLQEIYVKMFNHIAGEDGTIDAKELKSFFEKLDKKAGDDDMLSTGEAYRFAKSRGDADASDWYLGFIEVYDSTTAEAPSQFIKALFDTNKAKLAQEDKAKEIADNTTVDKEGNSTFREKVDMEHEGSKITERRTTKDKNGKVTKIEYYTEDKEMKADLYKDGKLVGKIYKRNDGYTHTDTIENGRTIKSRTDGKGGYWSVTNYFFDKDGHQTKSVVKNSDGMTVTDYGNRIVHQYKDGTSDITYWNNGSITKQVKKDKEGNVISSIEFKNNKEGRPILETHKDGKGNVTGTISHKYNSEGQETESISKDANGKIQQEEYYKNGYPTKHIFHWHNGSTDTTLFKPNSYDRKQEIRKDKNGNITESKEYFYDAKNREAKTVTKDGGGKILTTSSTEYLKNGTTKTVVKDINGTVTDIYNRNESDV